MAEPSRLISAVGRVVETADALWTAYGRHGPGNVDRTLFESVDRARADLDEALADGGAVAASCFGADADAWKAALVEAAKTVRDLAHHCVFRVEGMNFIGPEKGLIPRRDMIAKMQRSLGHLRRAHAKMVGG